MDHRRVTWQVRERLVWLAWLLDSSIPIPGTRLTIGLAAPITGKRPISDAVGVVLSSYIVREAAALGTPRSILARMAFNVALEGLVGVIPLAGDVFDAAFKANQRNVRLGGPRARRAAPREALEPRLRGGAGRRRRGVPRRCLRRGL